MGSNLRPLLLLDVDGVVNAISQSGDRSVWGDWHSGVARAGDEDWPILFSGTVRAAVQRWHNQRLAEIRWLADWGDDANGELRELLDLPEFEVVKRPVELDEDRLRRSVGADFGRPAVGRWWKFDAVLEFVVRRPDRPIVWLDDDLRFELGVQRWMREHTKSLLIAPSLHLGLSPRQLRIIEEFLLESKLSESE
ncbi:hypothetical protein [Geodermatophilus sp. SYSU D00710]